AAYTNQKGLNILDLKTFTGTCAVKAVAGSPASPAVWSPDSRKLMYALEHEWYSDFFVYDLATGKSTPFPFNNIKNFLSYPVAWLKSGEILFVVSSFQAKDGSREYTSAGYRSNLMLAGQDGNFRQLTDMDDFNYIEYAGMTQEEDEVLVIIRNKSEDTRQPALIGPGEKTSVEYLPGDGQTVSAGISPDGRFIVKTGRPDKAAKGYIIEILDREADEVIFRFVSSDYTADKTFLWHPKSRKLLYMDKSLENADANKLRQVIILPK
ncbi:MAG: hypothetical protein K6U74_10690, partial [Firmicutes bacterium]|nr:hypothetical protein [Bacillota bacterium]